MISNYGSQIQHVYPPVNCELATALADRGWKMSFHLHIFKLGDIQGPCWDVWIQTAPLGRSASLEPCQDPRLQDRPMNIYELPGGRCQDNLEDRCEKLVHLIHGDKTFEKWWSLHIAIAFPRSAMEMKPSKIHSCSWKNIRINGNLFSGKVSVNLFHSQTSCHVAKFYTTWSDETCRHHSTSVCGFVLPDHHRSHQRPWRPPGSCRPGDIGGPPQRMISGFQHQDGRI